MNAPKQFPNAIHDPGIWWDYLSQDSEISLNYKNLNFYWWEKILNPQIGKEIFQNSTFLKKISLLLNPYFYRLLKSSAESEKFKKAMLDPNTFEDMEKYKSAIQLFISYLNNLNKVQSDFYISFHPGVFVRHLNFNDSKNYFEKAYDQNGLIYRLTKGLILKKFEKTDVILVSTDDDRDLLTAMISLSVVKTIYPKVYISLINYSKENFILKPFAEKLEKNGYLFKIFDSIILGKEKQNAHVINLINELKLGNRPKGFLRNKQIKINVNWENIDFSKRTPLCLDETFVFKKILSTGAYENKCYWAKCAFCTQALKYEEEGDVEFIQPEIVAERFIQFAKQGFEVINISNEALPPKYLERFCNYLIDKNVHFKWSCLIRLDEHYINLFALMRKAGCYEVVFGFESKCERVLKLMNKYPAERNMETIEKVIMEANKAGLGIYLSLIMGFPTETLSELKETSTFICENLLQCKNLSFYLNYFTLFYGSDVFYHPEKYGVKLFLPSGDMIGKIPFKRIGLSKQSEKKYLQGRINFSRETIKKFGYEDLLKQKGGYYALLFYQITAQGSIFKVMQNNIFEEIRRK